jgi:signal transduction histidine kinase
VHDLLQDSPFSRLDLISCRNLMIYLNRGAQQRVFDIFHFALRPEGRMFLGTSEAIDESSQLFAPLDKKHRLYAARSAPRGNIPIPAVQSTLARSLALQDRGEPGLVQSKLPNPAATPIGVTRVTGQEYLSWSELHLKLIERFGAPSLVVNAENEILHLSEGATPFLQFSAGEPSTNLLRVVHSAFRVELRAALFRARQTNEAVSVDGIAFELQEQRRVVDVRVAPALELAPDFLLVSFILHPAQDAPAARPRAYDEPAAQQLDRELEQTKRHLRDIVEEHEASTEELKASNEELQAMNEELRSATEELETSREELQSINEELTTVNQELKHKVDELGHSNSDLHNLMGATAIATVFLDRDLHIMRFTPPAVALFSLIATDVGRPLADLRHSLQYPELLADARQVLNTLVPIEREVPEQGGRTFLSRLLPYRTTDDRIAGVVLTFVDVTERQEAQQAVKLAQQHLEVRVQERTIELDTVNAQLRHEVASHQRARKAQQELQQRLVSAQEEERSRISRELHDEVGQHMTGLMLGLKALEDAGPAQEMSKKLRELRTTTEQVGREIHQLAYQLRPIALDELGLARALSGYLEGWAARTGIAVDFVTTGIDEARLPKHIETTLYRIAQEGMNNVSKHADAKNVSVSIERKGELVLAIIEDDGAGFDSESMGEGGDNQRIGIAGMRERVAIVGGELTIESSVGHGTTLRVKLPL